MGISRRDLIGYGAGGAATVLTLNSTASNPTGPANTPPLQVSADPIARATDNLLDRYDMRDYLQPKRLTLAMWDVAYALRHVPGGSFADYDRVLDETIERGYNTVRIDPMLQWIDLSRPERVLSWSDPKWPYQPWLWSGASSTEVIAIVILQHLIPDKETFGMDSEN